MRRRARLDGDRRDAVGAVVPVRARRTRSARRACRAILRLHDREEVADIVGPARRGRDDEALPSCRKLARLQVDDRLIGRRGRTAGGSAQRDRAEPGAGSVIGGRGPGERTGVVLAIGSEGDDLGRRGKRAGTVVGDVLKIGGEIDSLGRRAIGPVGARGAVAAGGAVLHLHDRGLVADVVRRGRRRRDDHARRPRRKLPRLKINGVLGCRGDRAARGGAQRHRPQVGPGAIVGDGRPAQRADVVLAIGGEADYLRRRVEGARTVIGELLAIGGEVEGLRGSPGGAVNAVGAVGAGCAGDAILNLHDAKEVADIVRCARRRDDDHARRPRRELARLQIDNTLTRGGDRSAGGGAQRHAAEITSGGVVGDRGPAQGAGIVLAIGGEGDHLARRRQRAGAVVGELLAIGGEVERLRRGAGGAGGAVLAIRPVDAVLGNDDRDEVAQIVRGAARRRDD